MPAREPGSSTERLLQSATDIFVGWTSARGLDFYVRQYRDMKIIPDAERIAPRLVEFAAASGEVLARAHARTGDSVAISSYIGRGARFDDALSAFARAYADQNDRDHGHSSPPSLMEPSRARPVDRTSWPGYSCDR